MRALRWPPSQEEFDLLPLTPTPVGASRWLNLRWREHATKETFLFASESGRLTPGNVPCVYLSTSHRTSFRELYGDALYFAQKANRLPNISLTALTERVFVRVDTPALRVCDLTDGSQLEAIGIDLATLTAPAIEFPRQWAERILRHPAQFDGIRYESRHTKQVCMVTWARYDLRVAECPFQIESRLIDHVAAYSMARGIGTATLFDEVVAVSA